MTRALPTTAANWLNAARVIRPRQAVARVTRPARRRRFPRRPTRTFRALGENRALWTSPVFARRDVRPDEGTRLAGFHGHYGDDVLEAARSGGDAADLARAWIAAHPPRNDDAWHPYVVSTRAANWIAAATIDEHVAPVVRDSLLVGLGRVAANVEDDVLGNHVIRNAKALVLGGVAFGDVELRRRGERLLARELPQQALSDGGHYERSPAYHRLVLRDLLEVRAFAGIDDAVARMSRFAAASARPDGHPWLFNDGGVDVAPTLELPPAEEGLAVFAETGYVFLRRGELALAFDCGPVSPPFLPAHAHADALSFQLWWRGEPVVVDPGMPTYDSGAERDFLRSSAAHSTVHVGPGQFVPWGAFRAGPLPQVQLVDATSAELVGRVRTASGAEHVRRLRIGDRSVEVEDEVHAPDGDVRSTLVLAAGADPAVRAAMEPQTEERSVSERFGERRPARALVQSGSWWRIELG